MLKKRHPDSIYLCDFNCRSVKDVSRLRPQQSVFVSVHYY